MGTPDRAPNRNTSGQVNPHGDSILCLWSVGIFFFFFKAECHNALANS